MKYDHEKMQSFLDGKWERADDICSDGRHRQFFQQSSDEDGGLYLGFVGMSDGKGKGWMFSRTGFGGVHGYDCARRAEGWKGPERLVKDGAFHVLVLTKMNTTRTSVHAKMYELPSDCAAPILKLNNEVIGSSSKKVTTSYNIIFSDGNGEEVSATVVSFDNRSIANVFLGGIPCFGGSARNGTAAQGLYVSPMVHCDAESFERWIGFDIPRDELPNIKSVTVELAE